MYSIYILNYKNCPNQGNSPETPWDTCFQHKMLQWMEGFHALVKEMSPCWPGGTSGKESACQCRRLRDSGSIPGSGRSPGEGNGKQLQYSCLGNSMDRGAWWATVPGVAKSWTRVSNTQNQGVHRVWSMYRKVCPRTCPVVPWLRLHLPI